MGGPRRGGIGLADTKAPMVRGWDPSKSLSAGDGAGRLQMGPLGWGKRSGARPALSAAPPPPFISAPETGHPRLHYRLICIDTPSRPPGAFQSNLNSPDFGVTWGWISSSVSLLRTCHPRALHFPAAPFFTFQGTRMSPTRATKDPAPSPKPKKLMEARVLILAPSLGVGTVSSPRPSPRGVGRRHWKKPVSSLIPGSPPSLLEAPGKRAKQ